MDRTAAAVRLPPVAYLVCIVLCAVVIGLVPAAPAGARALAPPPVRLAALRDRPPWASAPVVWPVPPPGRWGAAWAVTGPLARPIVLRSLHGRT